MFGESRIFPKSEKSVHTNGQLCVYVEGSTV